MSRKLRITLIILFSSLLVVSLVFLGISYFDYKAGDDLYEESRTQFVVELSPQVTHIIEEPKVTESPNPEDPGDLEESPEPEEIEEAIVIPEPGILVDFEGLSEINPDIFGWIYIPETAVNYPLLVGVDNKKYLKTAYDLSYSRFGSIFLDKANNEDLSDPHTIIYGHNMGNGAMFNALTDYGNQAFLEEHPVVYILTPEGYRKYQIFSAHRTHVDDGVFVFEFNSSGDFQNLINLLKRKSWVSSDITPTTDDKILTLSTCTLSNQRTLRFVVHAVLIEKSFGQAEEDAGRIEEDLGW